MKSQTRTGIKVVAGIKAGGLQFNHNRSVVVIRVRSNVKAGAGIQLKNHSRRLLALF
jgi:hypothetical protein